MRDSKRKVECMSHAVGRFPFGNYSCFKHKKKREQLAEDIFIALIYESEENFFPFDLLSIHHLFLFQMIPRQGISDATFLFSCDCYILGIFSGLKQNSFQFTFVFINLHNLFTCGHDAILWFRIEVLKEVGFNQHVKLQ